MKLIVGLGNPGKDYARTRHNVGFWVIDALAKRFGVTCDRSKWHALVGEARVGREQLLLCKPQTFMNLSGQSVGEIVHFYSTLKPESDIIVIYDDMDLPVGRIRLRERGGSGGHNGVKSIIAHLSSEEFFRIRVGIGRPAHDTISHVLGGFNADDAAAVDESVERAADAAVHAAQYSFTSAMNHFNLRG